MDTFEYEFIQRAFAVGGLIAIVPPCMGQVVLLRRLSTIGDILSHSSLTGLIIGLVLGFNPLLTTIITCVFAGLSIEVIRDRLKLYQEVSTVIVLTVSIGLAGIFSSMVKDISSISSCLLGPIVTISDEEFYLVMAVSTFVLVSHSLLYKSSYLSILDRKATSMLGINIKSMNFCVIFLSTIAISISAKTIGSLVVSLLLVLPSISAMQYTKTYKNMLIVLIIFSVIFVYLGPFISYILNLRLGSVVVLLSVIWSIVSLIIKRK